MRILLIYILLIILNAATPVMAQSEKEYKSQINGIAKEIKETSRNLNANRKLLKTEQHKLLEIEQKISKLKNNSKQTEQKIKEQKTLIDNIGHQISTVKDQQKGNIESVKTLLVQQYINGEPNYLKMLLNQENPYAVGRLGHYYKYYQTAHSEKLDLLEEQLSSLRKLEAQKVEAIADLTFIQLQQDAQKKELKKAQGVRQAAIKKIDGKVVKSSAKLKKLTQNRDRLNALLKQIAKQAKEMKRLEEKRAKEQKNRDLALKKPEKTVRSEKTKTVKGGFKKQKGRLKLPVSGTIKYKFGSRLAESGMLAEGMLFETKKDQNVHSIFRGRVVFADWLKGYGLLVIVDHGDDHISLYGHNELLYKKVGDMIDSNEVIAKAGTTGGLKKDGVYFEIRHRATPINPSLWCK